jgi:hypothetical protein
MKHTVHFAVAVLTLALVAFAVPAFSQPGIPGGADRGLGPGPQAGPAAGAPLGPGAGMGPGARMGALPAPAAPVVVVAGKLVYVAFAGKIMAFEAGTLKKVAEATYVELPERGDRPGLGQQRRLGRDGGPGAADDNQDARGGGRGHGGPQQ